MRRMTQERIEAAVLGIIVLALLITLLSCGPTEITIEPEPEVVCTTFILTTYGETRAFPNYRGPPIANLAAVEKWWTEGCDP